MAIPYKKEIVKPDGRKLIAGGPRDQQRRVKEFKDQDSLIAALRIEIDNLKNNVSVGGEFTGEQVDEKIRKAVTEALTNERLKSSNKINNLSEELQEKSTKINELNGEIGILNEKIISLTTTINERDKSLERERERNKILLQQVTTTGEDLVIEEDRPKMEPVFIDPLEKSAGETLVPHIKVNDVKSEQKAAMQSKVDKLKGLMGQLPNRD